MKAISPTLQAHLDGELTTLAMLVKITRTDGVVKGFTSCDTDLVVSGVTYLADGALTASALSANASLASDSMEVTGILDSSAISDADIEAGLYDHARIDVYICNWADVTQGVVQMRRGWIGQLARLGTRYTAELRGLHDLLQRPIGATYTPECRFDLGDASCGVNLALFTVTGSATSVTDKSSFADATRSEATGTFNYGKLTWVTGANAGLSMEVKTWDLATQTFTLWLPMAHAIQIGDTYSVYAGCDKRFTTCRSKFANGAKFGGFPHVPGIGNILKYPT